MKSRCSVEIKDKEEDGEVPMSTSDSDLGDYVGGKIIC